MPLENLPLIFVATFYLDCHMTVDVTHVILDIPDPPASQHATLKSWEGPEDEAIRL